MHSYPPKFRLKRNAILVGILSATFPITGYCIPAGRVDFVIGSVEAVTLNGAHRTLTKGSEINAGDSINTAVGARAQVRFVDGGYISLQPNTNFRVDEYSYKNKMDSEEKGFFSLLKGGFRAITGAIGHGNRDAYRVSTPTATIGIRGTGYRAEIRDQGLLVSVGEGAVFLTNNMGSLLVTSGGAAFVASINTPPTTTTEKPNTPPASIQTQITTTSSTATTVPPVIVLPSLKSGTGYELIYAARRCADCSPQSAQTVSNVAAKFNETSQLIEYIGINNYLPTSIINANTLGTANVSFSATDGIIGWGRWDNVTNTPEGTSFLTAPSTDVFHYVVGIPTATMPTSGSASYSLMGYTTPTANDGSTGWAVTKGDLTVNFGGSNTIAVNMIVANTSNSYTLTSTGTQVTGTGATFSGLSSVAGGTSASASINGFFAGDNASRAGLSYSITDTATISGVAVFAQK